MTSNTTTSRSDVKLIPDSAAQVLYDELRVAGPVEVSEDEFNGLLSALQDMKPRDHVEKMLVAQMLLSHRTAMYFMQSIPYYSYSQEREEYQLGQAARFMRLFSQQAEALRKYRSGGKQTITVNHVTAGQAIVGNVTTTERG